MQRSNDLLKIGSKMTKGRVTTMLSMENEISRYQQYMV